MGLRFMNAPTAPRYPVIILLVVIFTIAHWRALTFMSKEVRLFCRFRPKLYRIGKRMYSLLMAANERACEVYALKIVLLRLKVRYLTNVVTVIESARGL